jgi:hypothetical protein
MRAFAALLPAVSALLLFAGSAQAGPSCGGGQHLIDETLANGARWQLCWEARSREGISYYEIYYTPPGGSEQMILAEASLAQIHVPYDDNGARFHDITDYGAGGGNQNDLASSDCPGGTRLTDSGKQVICQRTVSRGNAYDGNGLQDEGWALDLFSVSHIGAYNYIPEYRFFDDGTIELIMGATGKLQRTGGSSVSDHGWPLNSSGTRIGISHLHNYFWRLDFDIGGTATDDVVEQLDFVPAVGNATRQKTVTAFTTETAASVGPDQLRSWRVRDGSLTNAHGHPISYEIEALDTGHRDSGPAYEPFTHDDLYVTKASSCERYISHNNQVLGCGDDVTDFVDGESLVGEDLVVWFGLTFHHIPRDEDESRMHAHWNGYRLVPRNWVDNTPLVTNLPPVLADPGEPQSDEGESVNFALSATDPETDPLTYAATGLPPGLVLDTGTGVVTGILDYDSAGTYPVQVEVADATDHDDASFDWTVADVNRAPVWTDPGPQSHFENQGISLATSASDPDGEGVTYSATGLPPGLAIDPNTGEISGLLGYDAAGVHDATLTASDGSDPADQALQWTVTNVNRAPVWTDPGPQASDENDSISLATFAGDPDGEGVTYSATGLPPGLAIDPNTGEISGLLGYDAAGVHDATLTATDSSDPADQALQWTVTNVNRAPVWTDPGPQASDENESIALATNATDPDGEDVDYSATGLPPGLSIDTETGAITGVLSDTSAGVHNVTLTATDGNDATQLAVEWTVTEVVTVNVPALAPWAVVTLALGLLQIGRRRLATR